MKYYVEDERGNIVTVCDDYPTALEVKREFSRDYIELVIVRRVR